MAKKEKKDVLRVRKQNKTERSRLSTMVVPDKKKEANKKKCRKKEKSE